MGLFRITISKDEFNTSYTAIMTAAEHLDVLLNNFKSINNNMTDAWKGKSGNTFNTVTNVLEENVVILNRGLSRLAAELQEAYDEFNRVDNTLAGNGFPIQSPLQTYFSSLSAP